MGKGNETDVFEIKIDYGIADKMDCYRKRRSDRCVYQMDRERAPLYTQSIYFEILR